LDHPVKLYDDIREPPLFGAVFSTAPKVEGEEHLQLRKMAIGDTPILPYALISWKDLQEIHLF